MKNILLLSVIFCFSCKTSSPLTSNIPSIPSMEDISNSLEGESVPNIADVVSDFGKPPVGGCQLIGEDEPNFDEVFTWKKDEHESIVALPPEPPEYNSPPLPITRTGGCINFDVEKYNKVNSGPTMAARIKLAPDTKTRKKVFLEEFGPLAVYIQSKTNYPASALLGQWSDEASWGTSNQVKVNNNIAGHSCFKERESYLYPEKKSPSQEFPEYIKPPTEVKCVYPRPKDEGGFYITFGSILHASLSQVYNILDNPATNNNYKKTRLVVKEATEKGQRANPYKIIDGLEGYAAFPPSYRDRLKANMKKNGFDKFDNMEICDEKK